LSKVVLEQAGWVGALGLGVGAIVCVAFMALARRFDVPVVLDVSTALACVCLIMAIAMASGLMALRVLRRAEPATLLR
jgi:putative ABC transport system permease protein